MRLDKFVCKSTEFTKAQAIALIKAGKVSVNTEVIFHEATQVHENNDVILDGKKLVTRAFRYILMHKPANTICSNVDEFYPSLFSLMNGIKGNEMQLSGCLNCILQGV